ncbi:MAG TPA: LuxR C-terminal-related transcriptional regulator [Pseudomonadales bacterium]
MNRKDEPLQRGRDAYRRGAWREAYEALLAADQAAVLASEDLERLATAAYLVGLDAEFLRCMERLHTDHVQANDPQRAARYAFWLALGFLFRGEPAQANAWMARGQRYVQDTDCAERGYLLVPAAEQMLRAGDTAGAEAAATNAMAIGEQCADTDLTAIARHLLGRIHIHLGRVQSGLTLLDETMLAAVAGELSPIVTGLMYCSVIEACRDIHEFGRSREWTLALARWCEAQSEMVAFTDACLIHRAEILALQGAWDEAFADAQRACERAEASGRPPPGPALYQIGEIHRLRGEDAPAEAAFRQASRLGHEPQPGLALLRLAQGRVAAASAAAQRLMTATRDRIARSRLLPAYIEIMLEAGERERARPACEELARLAETFATDVLRAWAAQARGALALHDGDAGAALDALRQAYALWRRIEAPYEAARVRVLIGRACIQFGDAEAGALEFDAARSEFVALGARADVARLDELRSRSPSAATPLTARELEVLRLIAAGHTNKRIANTLGVSERTVDRHVSNILVKLDVPSRSAATAYGYAHRLL